jgi:hypothetical protein
MIQFLAQQSHKKNVNEKLKKYKGTISAIL